MKRYRVVWYYGMFATKTRGHDKTKAKTVFVEEKRIYSQTFKTPEKAEEHAKTHHKRADAYNVECIFNLETRNETTVKRATEAKSSYLIRGNEQPIPIKLIPKDIGRGIIA